MADPNDELQVLVDRAGAATDRTSQSASTRAAAARARVLKRVQSSALAGAALRISMPPVPTNNWSRVWLGGAASATLLASAAAVALHGRQTPTSTLDAPPVTSAAAAPSRQLEPASTGSVPSTPPELSPRAPSAAATSPAPGPARPVDSYVPELELLHRAHAAYGTRDFANALRLLAEHGRRFPNGRLAEEREALRVRALNSSGQSETARRAAHAFAARFPHSVLLSRTMATVDAGD